MPSGPKKRRAAKKKKELEENLTLKSTEKSQDVISISTSCNADQEDIGSLGGDVAIVVMSKLEDESEKEAFSVGDEGIQANVDFDPDLESKENEKISEPEPSLSVKEDSTMSPSQKKRMLLVKDFYKYRTKIQDSKLKTEVESAEDAAAHVNVKVTQENVDESARETEDFVSPFGDESSKKSTKDAAKMTQKTVASDPNGEKTEPAEGPVQDDFKMSEHNDVLVLKENEENVVPSGADKTSQFPTSILTYLKANEDISPAFEDNFREFIGGSNFIKDKDKHNLGLKDASNTKEDELVFHGNNSIFDTPSADEIGLKDSSVAIPVEDGSSFITKQDSDDISLSTVVHGVDTADKENEVDIQIQNDKRSLNSRRAASPSFSQKMLEGPKGDDQHEALQATKSTITNPELNQTSLLVSSSSCILCELVGLNVIRDGKILTTGVQINRLKKMLEEELLANDKLRATLKKLLDDLEAAQNNSDFGLAA